MKIIIEEMEMKEAIVKFINESGIINNYDIGIKQDDVKIYFDSSEIPYATFNVKIN